MMYKISISQLTTTVTLLIATLLPIRSVQSVPCGKWYSRDCLADNDIRYDDSVSYSLKDQALIWKRIEGFYVGTVSYLKGGKDLITEPEFYDPNAAIPALPYQPPFKAYLNVTIQGSRAIFQEISTAYPADPFFCELPAPEGKQNHIGRLTCGEHGLLEMSTTYFTSTYSKDGSAVSLPNMEGNKLGLSSKVTAVDDYTWYGSVRTEQIFVSITSKCVDGEICDHYASVLDYFALQGDQTVLMYSKKVRYDRLASEQAFREFLQQGLEDSSIPEAIQRDIDLDAPCLSQASTGIPCATEEQWCEHDPVCREDSPFEEPGSSLEPHFIAAVVIVGTALLLAAVYYWHQRSLAKSEYRYKYHFASRIAETIHIGGNESIFDMTPEKLGKEFEKIDVSKVRVLCLVFVIVQVVC